MNIEISWDSSTSVKIMNSNTLTDQLLKKYPDMAMTMAMEELSELAIAISKGQRNGSKAKIDNIAEEITDVLVCIQWIIKRFGITPEQIDKWTTEKQKRFVDRMNDDSVVFRTEEARAAYNISKEIIPQSVPSSGLVINKLEDGRYSLQGDVDDIPEYYHVLSTAYTNWLQQRPRIDSKPKKKKKSIDNPFKQYEALTKAKDKSKKKGKKK